MNIRNGAALSAVLMVLFAGGAVSVADGVPGRVLKRETVAIVEGKETAVPSIAMGDADSIAIILKEGKDNNKVMEHITHLTKQIGTRLTGSSNCEKANRWCAAQYESWGLTGVQVEQWGEVATRFDRGPSTMKMVIKRQAPAPRPAGEGGAGGRAGGEGGRGGEGGGRGEGGRRAEGGEQPAP
ncbi:MAG TPA: hypothetical protein VFF65_04140, partial [Phycisphaerales bacterium]|nr:hypothetical protein [Phycisphaerales bacterium]